MYLDSRILTRHTIKFIITFENRSPLFFPFTRIVEIAKENKEWEEI